MIRKAIIVILIVLMAVLTAILYTSSKIFLFTDGSMTSMMKIAPPNTNFTIIFFLASSIALILYLNNPKKVLLPVIATLLLSWFVSGRTFGTIIYPDGRISTGWFYLKVDRLLLCGPSGDCESIIYKKTKVECRPFWRLHIENGTINDDIFIGPFIWNKTLQILEEIPLKVNQ